MRGTGTILAVLLATLAGALVPTPLPAQEWAETVIEEGKIEDDLYVAAAEVEIRAEVEGDVLVGGGRVSVRGPVTGDISAIGVSVEIEGRVGDDVRVAGGFVVVAAEVGDDLAAAGANVRVEDGAEIRNRAWLAGNRVVFAGTVDGDLRAAARALVLSGTVGGDAHLTADEITVLPGARIDGDLVYTSIVEAEIDPGAEIRGAIVRERIEPAADAESATVFGILGFGFLILLGLMCAGIVLYLLFPNFTVSAARTIGRHPLKSVALGFAMLLVIPGAALVLMVTLLGIPLGFVLVFLYPIVLLLGYLTTAFFLGDAALRLLRRWPHPGRAWRVLSFLVALVAVWFIGALPYVGGFAVLLALMFGLGALALRAYQAEAAISATVRAEDTEI